MKRLIVCCDGTWQSLQNVYPTNVLKLAQSIEVVDAVGVHQVVYYDGGVGTGRGSNKISGGAFGTGIDDKIQDAYRFLCLNYATGDEVYLFGYSRGAYTVRSLAGFIYNSGLLHREHIRKTPEAYELYRDRADAKKPSGELALDFRQRYGDRIVIKVLACWDTVGSLGVPEVVPLISEALNRRYRFYDTTLNPSVSKAFHAMAVDEIREVFNVTPMLPNPQREPEQVVQAWFPGEHSCIGGGSKALRGLSDATLEWMLDQVEPLGLGVDRSKAEDGIQPDPTVPFDNRPTGVFKLTGTLTRRIEGRFDDLHYALRRRWKEVQGYDPKNLEPFEKDLQAWSQ